MKIYVVVSTRHEPMAHYESTDIERSGVVKTRHELKENVLVTHSENEAAERCDEENKRKGTTAVVEIWEFGRQASPYKTPTVVDKTGMFKDNILKNRYRRLWHWTGGDTATGALNWLDERMEGSGSVGYNYIVDEEKIYVLVEPEKGFLQSSNLGVDYDSETIAVAIVSKGEYPSKQTIETLKFLVEITNDRYNIFEDVDHHTIYPKKPDFPPEFWERFQKDLGLNELSKTINDIVED